ncbi:hypothetical protein YPPY16_2881, partial [Yersinia pestis PY-16]
MNASS